MKRHERSVRVEIKREYMMDGKNTASHAVEIEREALLRLKDIERLVFGD